MAVFLGSIGATGSKKIKSIEIWGKKWFQKSYGNTYHAVRVYVNGELIGTSPIRYGYGDQYIETGEDVLKKAGYLKRKDPNTPLWRYAQERKIKFTAYADNVNRESDLKAFIR